METILSVADLKVSPPLDEYQSRFVTNVRQCIGANWLARKPNLRILDTGCDTSGRQLWHLKQLTRGEVVGINIPNDFPSDEAREVAGPGTSMFQMDGMELTFPDESFDMVVSANVMEHVPDTEAYIRQCARVLKPNGVAYIETAPVWSSARGHHIMESMVKADCPEETRFADDGSVIPDWAHLKMSESELIEHLQTKLRLETCDYIREIIYHSNVLNKTPWSRIKHALRHSFLDAKIMTWPIAGATPTEKPTDGKEDYDVYGFSVVGRKQTQGALAKRLCWRLRKWGL